MPLSEFFEAESCMNRSKGHCMTMGTASTMASMVEALGMSLPGNAAIPAVDARRNTLAQLTGRRIVQMVEEDLRISKILTRPALENAIFNNAAKFSWPISSVMFMPARSAALCWSYQNHYSECTGPGGMIVTRFDALGTARVSVTSRLDLVRLLKFQSRLKRNHPGATVASKADTEQPGGWGCGVRQRTESGLRRGFTGNAGQNHAGKPKIRMVEDIEELGLHSELHTLGHRKPFREVDVIPEEIGTAQGIAAEVSELAMLWVVAARALSCTRINSRYKGVRIQPLDRARLRYTRDGMVLIQR